MPQMIAAAIAVQGIQMGVEAFTQRDVKRAARVPVVVNESVDRTIQNIAEVRPPDALGVAPNPGGPQIGIFGKRRVGGRVVLSARDTSNIDWLVIVLAGAPLTSIDGLYLDNVFVLRDGSDYVTTPPYNLNSVQVKFYDGTQIAADTALSAAFPGWTSQFKGLNCAYARIRINKAANAAAFGAGVPNFTFAVQGFKCYDPRNSAHNIADKSTWTYSGNSAVVNANYYIHELGAGFPTSLIDWASVATAADTCDEPVLLASGTTEPRYQAAIVWTTDERHEEVDRRIGATHLGGMYLAGRKYRVATGAFPAGGATQAITTDDYIGAGLTFADTTPIASLANGVRGTFSSPKHNFEPRDFPSYQDAAALAADGGRAAWLDLDLAGVASVTQAQRVARAAYRLARDGFPASVNLQFTAFNCIADDVVSLTDIDAGFSAQTFRVLTDEFNADTFDVRLTLRAEAATAYAWAAATDEKPFTVAASIYGVVGTGSASGDVGDLASGGATLNDANASAGTFHPRLTVVSSPTSPAPTYKGRMIFVRTRVWKDASGNVLETVNTTITVDAIPSGGIADFGVDMTPASYPVSSDPFGNGGHFIGSHTYTFAATSVQLDTIGAGAEVWGVVLSGSVTSTALDNITDATTPYYLLATPCAPYVSSGAGTAYTIKTNQVPGAFAVNIELSSFNDTTLAAPTVVGTTANISGGASFNVTGAAGTGKYYRMRAKSASGQFSAYSNPLLLVYS